MALSPYPTHRMTINPESPTPVTAVSPSYFRYMGTPPGELSELLMYRNGVEDLADSKSSKIHYNSGPKHAMIVLSNIFRTATKEINIFAGSFDERVCSAENKDYIESLKLFLYNGGVIKVLLNSFDNSKDNPIITLLSGFWTLEKYKNKIFIKTTSERILEDGREIHFTTADDRMFRKEVDIQKFIASFSFNQPEESDKLDKIFNSIFSDNQKSTSLLVS